ncbi:unnamed protein product [Vitrella brassicaformis CCMP3155]|uniref:Major facilitator superfamily (MFS) profile domain-containing protein n=1 Tax=Vitrella brassicaformis (strain CCMP3155) TaxID=1169540 RepID=A0A0G4EED9_VITBC|nr:unnamed protein product [Vitrella brassicaformis CCMP3155]|eukprot:CEL93752.1 unnamed protein product [Vitrella brassicaformis CCMP3155]
MASVTPPTPVSQAAPMEDTRTTTDRVRSFVARTAHTLDHFKQPDFAAAHVCLLLFAAAFNCYVTVLPFFVLALNLPITVVGYLRSVAFGVQIPGAIIFGILCDTYGSRFGFLLAFASCILSFLTTAAAICQWMLYRGFIALELRSNRMAALFSVVLSGAALIVSQLAIPDIVTTSGERYETATEIFGRAMALLKDTLSRNVSSLLLLFFGMFPVVLARMTFAPAAVELYHLNQIQTGEVTSFIGGIMTFAEGVVAPGVFLFFTEVQALRISLVVQFLGFAIVTSLVNPSETATLFALIIPLIAGALNFVAIMSLMTTRVTENEVATVIGLNGASFSLLNTICPSIGLWLYSIAGLHAVFLLCLVWSGVVAVVFGVPSALYPKSYPLLSALDAHPPE